MVTMTKGVTLSGIGRKGVARKMQPRSQRAERRPTLNDDGKAASHPMSSLLDRMLHVRTGDANKRRTR